MNKPAPTHAHGGRGVLIVFSAHNAQARLPQMFERIRALEIDWSASRIVAVENACTDGTLRLLNELAQSLPMTVLRQPAAGKNRALNTALRALGRETESYELVVFTDDDVAVDPQWIAAHLRAARANPGFDIFGGSITPRWPHEPPRWHAALDEQMGVLYARTDAEAGPCSPHFVWGPNFAVRGSVFTGGTLRFDETFGPDGTGGYAMGSETEFVCRLFDAGHKAYFTADAAVEHLVRPEQLAVDWVMARAYRHGLGAGRRDPVKVSGRGPVGPFLWLCKEVAAFGLQSLVAGRGRPRGHLAVRLRYKLNWARGFMRGIAHPATEGAGPLNLSRSRRKARSRSIAPPARANRALSGRTRSPA